jgi:hypothetical protein
MFDQCDRDRGPMIPRDPGETDKAERIAHKPDEHPQYMESRRPVAPELPIEVPRKIPDAGLHSVLSYRRQGQILAENCIIDLFRSENHILSQFHLPRLAFII